MRPARSERARRSRARRAGPRSGLLVLAALLAAACTSLDRSATDRPGDGATPSTAPTTAPPPTTEPAPPLAPAVARIADRTMLTAAGRDLLARSSPQLVDTAQLRRDCTIPEQTNVLGCFDGRRITVLDLSDPRLDGMEEVTTAHELLHAVWERLDEPERARLTPLLRAAYDASTDGRLREKVEAYRRRDPTVVDHELHSILGSEVARLDPVLEAHYAAWFGDRRVVVDLATRSQGAFDELEAQIGDLDAQLEVLGREVAAAEGDLERSRAALEARAGQLQALRTAGRVDEYNAGVDPYNDAVAAHNRAVDAQRRRIERYNGTVAVRNALGADHDELVAEITTAETPVAASP